MEIKDRGMEISVQIHKQLFILCLNYIISQGQQLSIPESNLILIYFSNYIVILAIKLHI